VYVDEVVDVDLVAVAISLLLPEALAALLLQPLPPNDPITITVEWADRVSIVN
jgi:hypothetical protein